jgi:SAM-dependent methyltransferase
MTPDSEHTVRQREFYETRPHPALRPRDDDAYVENLVARLCAVAGIQAHHRVLEVGAGFGRFTFALAARCAQVTALDLSTKATEALARERDMRGIAPARVQTVNADVDRLEDTPLDTPFDAVVGFFVLHHLEDVGASLDRLIPWVRRDGAVAFLEPNRWNPLYLFQVACCPDMAWREEKGVWRLGARAVEAHCRRNGLEPLATERFGLMPPQVYNRSLRMRRFESWVQGWRWVRPVLPFLLLAARRPATETVSAGS